MNNNTSFFITSLICLLLTLLTLNSNSQNIYPYKLSTCNITSFCIDCGDSKAGFKTKGLDSLVYLINQDKSAKDMQGELYLQVLVDSLGRGCILSHTDQQNQALTKLIVSKLNNFSGWIPAKTENNKEEKSSISILFSIKQGKLVASKFSSTTDYLSLNKEAESPIIGSFPNKKSSGSFKDYNFTIWGSGSSESIHSISSSVGLDQSNRLFFIFGDSLISYNGYTFESEKPNTKINPNIQRLHGILTDRTDTKWFVGFKKNWKVAILSQNKEGWTDHTAKLPMIDSFYDFFYSQKSGKIIITCNRGILIWQSGKWTNITPAQLNASPQDNLYFAREDNFGRLWIGSADGTRVISTTGEVTYFNTPSHPLKGMTLTALTEDQNGNVYLGYRQIYKKDLPEGKYKGGVIVYDKLGKWKILGGEQTIVGKRIENLSYSQLENSLWVASSDIGIVRYELTTGSADNINYSIFGSDHIPEIQTTLFDHKGNLFIVTSQTLIKIEKNGISSPTNIKN